ncbi:MAG: excinuclease ABC subunit UvrC [Methanoculleaceae archaeon]
MIETAHLPHLPGCYLFRDREGGLLYIGKAKDLKRRVGQYTAGRLKDPRLKRLTELTDSVDFIVTENEVEALILENTLIKKHRPRYNINLRDAKNYAYIHISDGTYPRIGIARKATGPGRFYGPFVSAQERDEILAVVRRTFGLRSCRRIPKRPCLRYRMGTCMAPCVSGVTPEEYGEQVKRAEEVLKGRVSGLIESLERRMKEYAGMQEYEKALEIRDQIRAISHLRERQVVDRRSKQNEDVINYRISDHRIYLLVFHVHRGTLDGKEEFIFPGGEDFLEEFLVQYYSERTPPREIILPEDPGEAVRGYLSRRRGSRVHLHVPRRGAKARLLELAGRNVELTFFNDRLKVEALREALHLESPPAIIEAFDISHFAGYAMVGSMVRYRDGRPEPPEYRRFRIKTVEGIDDFAAIAEVVRRRYTRLCREGGTLPDLIIIDGGKGQLEAARRVLESLDLDIPVAAIAKREEEIFVPGFKKPLPLDQTGRASLFIQEIRDEAHRFAVSYHRLLREREAVQE